MKSPLLLALFGMIMVFLAELLANSFSFLGAVNAMLPVLVLMTQISILLFFLIVVFLRTRYGFMANIAEQGDLLALLIAASATGSSLFFQFGMGYVPCELCWFQRIFMYPLVLVLGIGVLKKQEDVFDYVIPFCILGSAVSVYHYSIQFLFVPSACSLDSTVGCSAKVIAAFGYITIPMMALTAFAGISILAYLKKCQTHQ